MGLSQTKASSYTVHYPVLPSYDCSKCFVCYSLADLFNWTASLQIRHNDINTPESRLSTARYSFVQLCVVQCPSAYTLQQPTRWMPTNLLDEVVLEVGEVVLSNDRWATVRAEELAEDCHHCWGSNPARRHCICHLGIQIRTTLTDWIKYLNTTWQVGNFILIKTSMNRLSPFKGWLIIHWVDAGSGQEHIKYGWHYVLVKSQLVIRYAQQGTMLSYKNRSCPFGI